MSGRVEGTSSFRLSARSMWRALACACALLVVAAEQKRLHDYVRHFEELNYDRDTLNARHNRVRRSTNDKKLYLDFEAFGRHFQLQLQPDTSVYSPHAEIEIDGFREPLDTSHIYSGELWGELGSHVHGSVIEGRFEGRIKRSDSGVFYVEAAEKFFSNPSFHSVIYKDDDVEDSKFFRDTRKTREASTTGKVGCGNSDPVISEWMRFVQSSVVPSEPAAAESQVASSPDDDPAFKYTQQGQDAHVLDRKVRQASANKKTCTLFLQSDPQLWRYYNETFYGSRATADQVKQQISALFSAHVNEVNGIYIGTPFKDTSGTTPRTDAGYNFRVDRVLINTTAPCDDRVPSNDHPYCNQAIDASNLLNLNSYRNHDGYCLAFVFTYRDFSGGTLGLAWVADPGPSKGGICTKYAQYRDDGSQVYKSLNTGIVTIVNYGKVVPQKVSVITFAHEVGHNFGSPHDDPTMQACAPLSASKSAQGNFIMFASATSGDMSNNNKFSPCSIEKISAVLMSVQQQKNGHVNCFQESQQAFCGNAIREEGEQCDCGYAADCGSDVNCCKCCVGAAETSQPTSQPTPCKLKPDAICDPSAGPCCKSNCRLYTTADGIICKPATDCQEISRCTGNSSSCPAAIPKANLTACNQNTQVCINGECTSSICVKISGRWSDCEPPLPADGSTDSLCYMSCQDSQNGTCWSSKRVDEPGFPQAFKALLTSVSNGKPIALSPGRACNSYKGYCDVFHKCRLVDADGPLARLKNLLFNPSTLATVKNWVEVYWWAVALIVLGVILLMAGFIKLCAVHTPSSNPNKPKARRLSETLTLRRRRAEATAQQQHQAQAGRQQAPQPAYPSASTSGAPPPYSGLAASRPVPAGKGKRKQERYEMS